MESFYILFLFAIARKFNAVREKFTDIPSKKNTI